MPAGDLAPLGVGASADTQMTNGNLVNSMRNHYSDVIMGRWRLKSPASRLFTRTFIQAQIKENTKAPRHWPLCGNSQVTGEFPAQMSSNAENVSIWWRHHDNYFAIVGNHTDIALFWILTVKIWVSSVNKLAWKESFFVFVLIFEEFSKILSNGSCASVAI